MNFIKINFFTHSCYKLRVYSFILCLLIGDFFYIKKTIFDEKESMLRDSSNKLSNQLDIVFDQNKSFLQFIARKFNSRENIDLNYINKILISTGELKIQSLTSSYISWASPSGCTLVSGEKGVLKDPDVSIKEREYFLTCKQTPWTIQISKPTQCLFSNRLVLPTAMGVSDKNGVFLGYLLLGLKTKELDKLLSTVISPNVEFVFSYKNQPTFSSPGAALASLTSFSEEPSILYSQFNIRQNTVLNNLPFVLHTTFKPGYIQSSIIDLMMKHFSIITLLLLLIYYAYYKINNNVSKNIINMMNKRKNSKKHIKPGIFFEDLILNQYHFQKTLDHLDAYLSEIDKEREHYHSMSSVIKTSEKEWKKLIFQINNNVHDSIEIIYQYLDIIITDEKNEYNDILKNLKKIIFKIKNLEFSSEQTKKIDINVLIQKSIIINKIRSFNKNITVLHETPLCLEDFQGEESEYQQMIASLINFSIENSKKHTKILIRTSILDEKEKKLLHMQFIFKGFGLSPEESENLTSFFSQSEQEFQDPTRLKMPKIKHLISKHNGTLSFESTDQETSLISVFLPIYRLEKNSNKQHNNLISTKLSYH